MFRQYIRIFCREVIKHKIGSSIKIISLAIGMACCLIFTFWAFNQLSYDTFHKDVESIHMILIQGLTTKNNPSGPAPLAPALVDEIPEIMYATRYGIAYGSSLSRENNDNSCNFAVRAVDPEFFKIFSFPFIQGDFNTALDDLLSMVITKRVAETLFGEENPIGQVIRFDNKRNFVVTGLIENVPDNSSLHFDVLVPFAFHLIETKEYTGFEPGWGFYQPQTFIKLQDKCLPSTLNTKMAGFLQNHTDEFGPEYSLTALPMKDRHLFFSNVETLLFTFGAVGVLILVMASINFINLSIAQYVSRAKETGMRKVLGAGRKNLVLQFWGESMLFSIIALAFAMLMAELLLPSVNELLGLQLTLKSVSDPYILLTLLGLILVTSIVAGAYPAFFLSAFQPVQTLKGNIKARAGLLSPRRILVVVQFICSVLLIICSFVVSRQFDFVLSKDIGYDKQHVITIHFEGDSKMAYPELKNALSRNKDILGVSGCAAGIPYWRWTTGSCDWDGRNPDQEESIHVNYIDYDFIETIQIEMAEGRSFSRDQASDLTSGFLINERMAELMGLEDALGARLDYIDTQGKVVGVMKNFHFRPLKDPIGPLLFALKPDDIRQMVIRITPGDIPAKLEFIQETWETLLPSYPFQYAFLDEKFDQIYYDIRNMGRIAGAFALLAIAIACLGLIGLASFATERRTREIGIRKVFGASILRIVQLINSEFLMMAAGANIIAWPVAYYIMSRWLENYAYHTDLDWMAFALAGALVCIITMITVSLIALKAATANPVKSLRHE
ncbi:MAG: ABC transporter permease [Candidatus Zixiibacteriota bacterium]|nr:MAG: ABC transporter permease [candidate division Zixibacteria bacterium]